MADHEVVLRDKYKNVPGLNNQAIEDYNFAFKLDFAATDAVTEATPAPIIASTLTTAGDTVTIDLFTKTATQIINKVAVYIPAAGTMSTGSATITVGSDGDVDDFLTTATGAADFETAGFYEEIAGGIPNASATDHRALAADDIVARVVTAGGGAPADISAGVVWILLKVIDLNNIAKQ